MRLAKPLEEWDAALNVDISHYEFYHHDNLRPDPKYHQMKENGQIIGFYTTEDEGKYQPYSLTEPHTVYAVVGGRIVMYHVLRREGPK